jgi:hypothetical protein
MEQKYIGTLLGIIFFFVIAIAGILTVFKMQDENLVTGSFITAHEGAKFLLSPIIFVMLIAVLLVIYVCKRKV